MPGGSKKVLMACRNCWRSAFQVGSHQIATVFLEMGWEVGFMSDPISPLHLAGGMTPELRTRYELHRKGGIRADGGRLWAYVPLSLATPHKAPILRTEAVSTNWHRLTIPDVRRVVSRNGFGEVDLLYLDSPAFGFLTRDVKSRASVYRIADNTSGFERHTPAERRREDEICRAVDLVIYSASNLADYARSKGPRKALHVPNGVNFAHFQNGSRAEPSEYARIPRPRVIYVGALDVWFDYALVAKLAGSLPGVSFVIVGPDRLARQNLPTLKNLHLLGPRPYDAIPAYLANADAGMIPFNVAGHGRLIHSVNPLKLYEFMACGLPVVAIEWDELKRLQSPATLCRTGDEFAAGVQAALSRPPPKEDLIDFARRHDWKESVSAMLQASGVA